MRKILYFNFGYAFYRNKIEAQLKAFYELGVEPYLVTVIKDNDHDSLVFFKYTEENGVVEIKSVPIGNTGIFKSFSYYGKIEKEILKFETNNQMDYLYIRRLSIHSLLLVKLIKEMSKRCKVLYEWPTVPLDKYDSVYKNVMQKLEVLYYNVRIKKHITKEVMILQSAIPEDDFHYEIFNGVDILKYPTTFKKPKLDNNIKFIAVAHTMYWHGYDRFIKSLAAYSGDENVTLTVVSTENREIEKLKELAKQNGVEDKIDFIGEKKFEELDSLFNSHNIAVGGLGYHRKGAVYDTSIKNKEYCAFGIPFICSSEDRSFPENYPYLFEIAGDESIFSIADIIEWYKNISKEDYRNEMHLYASENLNFKNSFKKLFEELGNS